MSRHKRQKESSVSLPSDEGTCSSLPALSAPVEPHLPINEALKDQFCILETPGLPSTAKSAISSAIPGSAVGILAAFGGRTGAGLSRNGNFEGFHDKND
jgi:hypothetical protein